MGADWYSTLIYFGYAISIPRHKSYRKFVGKLYGLNGIIQKPFEITGVLSDFHSRMEYASSQELAELDDSAQILIGFTPPSDIDEFVKLANDLKEFVSDNSILEGLDIETKPQFFSGIDWFDSIDIEEDDSKEDEESDDEDSEEEFDDHGSEEESDDDESEESSSDIVEDTPDDDTSDEEECKISPESVTKTKKD